MTRQALMAVAAVILAALVLFLVGKWVFYPGSTEAPDVASGQEEPRRQPEEAATLPPASESEYASVPPESSREPEKPAPGARSESAKAPSSKSQKPSRPEPQAKVSERLFVRRSADPGIYQTIRPTSVRTRASHSASVVDEIGSGARLNVLGSAGEWLIVRSNKLKAVVYVKRDDAMFLPGEKPVTESFSEAEARWKKVESEIYQAFGRWGVKGVSVSFIGDTAYLIGDVKTEDERFRAEQAARTIPEVARIYNGVWVTP
jgi:hypothetical protein